MDITPLEEAGMTNGEIKVYLALIETGPSSIGPILEESGITKSIIYRILNKLIKKGLVSYIIKEKTKVFQAAQPSQLIEYIDKKKENLNKTREDLQKLIPEIIKKQAFNKKSIATIYEGFKGLMTAYEKRYDVLKKDDEVVIYGLPASQPTHHHAKWQQANKKLDELGIRSRLLYNYTVTNDVLKNRNQNKLCQARRMPENLETPSWTMIYKDTTLIAIPQGEHPLAVEIINQDIADSFKSYFELLWKQTIKKK
nr:hypothetical protein [Nanoarchaeum sp.]